MNRLKFLRNEKGEKLEKIAQFLNVTLQTVSNYENEKRDIPTSTLKKLADYFNVSTDYLLGKTDIRNPEKKEPDLLDLAKIGFSMDKYNPPNEKQKEQIRDILEIILKENKKDK